METAYLVPTQNTNVRAPDGSVLPLQGARKRLTIFWLRRIADGSVRIRLEHRDPQ